MDVGAVTGAVLGLVASGAAGYLIGRSLRPCRRAWFWVASIVSLLLGGIFVLIGSVAGLGFLSGGGIGVMTGGLNGIRWGFGRLSDDGSRIAPKPGECDVREVRRPGGEGSHTVG